MVEPSESPKTIDLVALHQEIAGALRQAELRAAELRGQLGLIERLIAETQARRSGAELGEQQA